MLVLDASCLYDALARKPGSAALRARVDRDDQIAPHIIDVEVFGVVGRDLLLGDLDRTAATRIIERLRDWPGQRFDHGPLLMRAWQLRDNVRGWDAMYVALAEMFQATLLTTDERLARAPGLACSIEVV